MFQKKCKQKIVGFILLLSAIYAKSQKPSWQITMDALGYSIDNIMVNEKDAAVGLFHGPYCATCYNFYLLPFSDSDKSRAIRITSSNIKIVPLYSKAKFSEDIVVCNFPYGIQPYIASYNFLTGKFWAKHFLNSPIQSVVAKSFSRKSSGEIMIAGGIPGISTIPLIDYCVVY